MSLKEQASKAFFTQFGYEPSNTFHAPGRVNLIGEHTDYNDGFVLPAAINFGTCISATKRDDHLVRVCAVNFEYAITEFSLAGPIPKSHEHPWSNYIRGVCTVLIQAGYKLTGVDMTIVGNVPYGAGLSSSAALEIVAIRTLLTLADERIDPTAAALLGQKTENEYIGAQTGIMDQLISASGEHNHALLIDCRDLSTRSVAMDPTYKIVIFNSNVKRGLVDSEYNTRRIQCQTAAEILKVEALRDATMEMLTEAKTQFDSTTFARARHVISENRRTLEAAEALESRDWTTMGELMAQSHQSMKDDFEITVPAIDGLVELITEKLPDRLGGARMTGGGFGGCVVSLIPEEKVDEIVQHIEQNYEKQFGIKESVYICEAVDGAFVAQ
jgi:galactokinase